MPTTPQVVTEVSVDDLEDENLFQYAPEPSPHQHLEPPIQQEQIVTYPSGGFFSQAAQQANFWVANPYETAGVTQQQTTTPELKWETWEDIVSTKSLDPRKMKREPKQPLNPDLTIGDLFKTKPVPRLSQAKIEEFISLQNLSNFMTYPYAESKNLVGIEVEVENVMHIDLNIPLLFWHADVDGSLRNNGREFRSIPIPLKYVQPALTQLFRGLNASIEFTNRTSEHVHLDVRGLTLNQVMGLLFTYTVLENTLFKFCGLQRRNNIFCVPITETNLFFKWNLTESHSLLKTIGTNWHKYTALNLLPIQELGTVEFRHMPGTSDIPKLLVWIDILNRIKTFAYRNSLEEITNQISVLNTNSQYNKFIRNVLGDLTVHLQMNDLKTDMEGAVYTIKHLSVNNDFHKLVTSCNMVTGSALQRKADGGLEVPLSDDQMALLKAIKTKLKISWSLQRLYTDIKRHPVDYAHHFNTGTIKAIIGDF